VVDDIFRGESGNRLYRFFSADLVCVFSDAGGYLADYLGLAANTEKHPEKKKGSEEFSLAWHMKVLAVIYVILGILYVVLRFTLK